MACFIFGVFYIFNFSNRLNGQIQTDFRDTFRETLRKS